MTRTALTIATALFAGFFAASSAQACISCEYVPEVVKAGEASHAKRMKQKRIDAAAQARKAPAKERIAKAEAPAKRVAPKTVETAAAEPVETKTETVTIAAPETATTALAKKPVKVAVAETTDSGTSCMKFMPTIGKTIEVPCP